MNKRCEVQGCQSQSQYRITAVLGQKDGELKKFDSKEARDSEGFHPVENSCKYHALKAGLSIPKPLMKPKILKVTNRNNPCVCGSGKKYKLCCWGKVQKSW